MKKVSNKLYKARKIMDYTGVVFLVLLLYLSGSFTGGLSPCLF